MNVSKGSLSVLKVGGEEIKGGERGEKRGNLLAEPDMRSRVCGSVRWGWCGDRGGVDDGGGVVGGWGGNLSLRKLCGVVRGVAGGGVRLGHWKLNK